MLIGIAVDIVINQEQSFIAAFGFTEILTQLWILAIITFILWGFESLFEYLHKIAWRNLAQTTCNAIW